MDCFRELLHLVRLRRRPRPPLRPPQQLLRRHLQHPLLHQIQQPKCITTPPKGLYRLQPPAARSVAATDVTSVYQTDVTSAAPTDTLCLCSNVSCDNITFAGYKLPPQSFAVVDTVSAELLSRDVSGLMGLGFQPLASSGVTPIWQNIINNNSTNGNISFPGFSFGLTRYINTSGPAEVEPGGLFTLGTLNASLIAPGKAISFVPMPPGLQSYWLIPMEGLDVNGVPLPLNAQSSPNVAIDTGTTLIGGPAKEVKQFYSQVIGSSPASGSYQGYYSYPCNSSVLVSFRFGGKNYSMAPNDFNLGPFGSNGRCLGSVFKLELSGASKSLISWVIGDSFLKNVLSVYRYLPPAVGFAKLWSAFNSTGASVVTAGGPLFAPGTLRVVEASAAGALAANASSLPPGLRGGANSSLSLGPALGNAKASTAPQPTRPAPPRLASRLPRPLPIMTTPSLLITNHGLPPLLWP
ncbi:hypothetical protein PCANC_23801 [Puccinia coronata f. sp. avenae]|uniref:Peptidase A1 domain-containing protein n=1 Tax=Puccinia coronata f. sp. avenae TaxID=200324 RepID=A0A2N5S9M9_9BASI|nr:hypothetical protein PCANC_23801 [Puccinia coronata f. sp. avenae]